MLRALMILAAAGLAAPAAADPVMAMSPMLMVGTTGVMAANDANERQSARRPVARNPFSAGFRRGPIDARAASVRLAYHPTKALQRQAEEGILHRLERKNPGAADALGQQMAKHDFGRVYTGLVGPFGLRDDDVVDIMTAYTALGYLIATGAPDPSRASLRALRSRIAAQLAGDPQFGGEARGRLGEEIKVLFVNLHAGWQSARKEGNVEAYADGVNELFEQQGGVDLRRVVLTDQGFVAR